MTLPTHALSGERWAEIRRRAPWPTRWWAGRLGVTEAALDGLRADGLLQVESDPQAILDGIAEAGRLRRRGVAELTRIDVALSALRQDDDPSAVLLELVVALSRDLGGPRVVAAILDAGLVPEGREGRDAVAALRARSAA